MDFETWFVEQHGPRPSAKAIFDLQKEQADYERRARLAKDELLACVLWEAQMKSAQYAWYARNRSADWLEEWRRVAQGWRAS